MGRPFIVFCFDVFSLRTFGVGVLVDVVDPQPRSSGRSQRRGPDSEPLREGLQGVELFRGDYARGDVLVGCHRVNLSCCMWIVLPLAAGAIHDYPQEFKEAL